MKKIHFFSSLPFRFLIGVFLGTMGGLLLNHTDHYGFSTGILNFVLTIKYVLGQFVSFCVPLIIICFIAPTISRLGEHASHLLGVAVCFSYISSLGAGLFSMIAGNIIFSYLSISTDVEKLRYLPNNLLFEIDIPQIMPVSSALVFSFLIGLASAWTHSKTILQILEEIQKMILAIVNRIIVPVLPYFIGLTFCTLSYEGILTRQMPVFLQLIALVLIGHIIWTLILYIAAGIYSHENPWQVVKCYGPAYLAAIGTMSSAATIAVSLQCAEKAKPLRKDMVSFGIPLFANIHLCGSVLTEVFFCMAISKILYGSVPSMGTMICFCILLGIFAIGAPGVPGGTVMASLGIITGVLNFGDSGTALMLTIFALQDSFGTACNVIGDGALTLILSGYVKKHHIHEKEMPSPF